MMKKRMRSRAPWGAWVAGGALALGGLGLGVQSVARADDDPCTADSFAVAKVEQACRSGGRKAAKTVMKAAVSKAKEAGESINCKSCHSDLKTYALTPTAVADLKKWM